MIESFKTSELKVEQQTIILGGDASPYKAHPKKTGGTNLKDKEKEKDSGGSNWYTGYN